MKKNILISLILLVLCVGCIQKSKAPEENKKIENSLKSISFLYDSVGINPSELLYLFDRVNKAIDSIGYPDAGYKLWLIQGDSIKDLRFMVEGCWPDQAVYDSIHNNVLYKNAWENEKIFKKMKTISYHRFVLVR
ncbi:MAG TPA: hypothetical protein PLJ84_10080 [Bacteroidales bacterium]|nr:hypothetical protein [Bacteroidales bacterium]